MTKPELTREQIEQLREEYLTPGGIDTREMNALCNMALRSLDKSMGEASAATEPKQQALGESPDLPPTLQGCLERISVVIALQNNPDRVGAFSTEMLRSIRSQLEAGKQCAEALEMFNPLQLASDRYSARAKALTQATATGLLASDEVKG